MSDLSRLIVEVGGSIERKSEPERARILSRLTDLFLNSSDWLGEEHVEVFDGVILRFVTATDAEARANLSQRIADLAAGPKVVLRSLALDDEIKVAGPVLARSPRLADQDLVAVAKEKGLAHRLAISQRQRVSETVTDVLVAGNDVPVRRAVAANPGAKLSPTGTAVLLQAARDDENLQDALGRRRDLPPETEKQLVTLARNSVKRRLVDTLPVLSAADVASSTGALAKPKLRSTTWVRRT